MDLDGQNLFACSTLSHQKDGNIRGSNLSNNAFQSSNRWANAAHERDCFGWNGEHSQ